MARLAAVCAVFLASTALCAACSVYDESLLGAGGVNDTSSSKSGKGGESGDGGAGATTSGANTGGGSSTTTGSSSGSSTSQTGTVTTGAECETPDDCPGEDSECAERSCEGSQCSVVNKEQDFVLSEQTAGDCLVQVCDGQGNVTSDVDDSDLPAGTDDCIIPTCDGGVLGEKDAPERDPCGDDDLCDGEGACVDCLEDDDCPGDAECSAQQACVEPECNDEAQNGNETDIDCGGGTCDPCLNGAMCDDGDDCVSGVCAGTCQPSCSDNIKNGNETDIDCGGGTCTPCALGLSCDDENDCTSDFCLSTVCRPAVFFSEYVEGSSNSKAIEVLNYGGEVVDLAAQSCFVKVYSNGNPDSPQNIGLTGSIPSLDVYVLCKSNSAAGVLSRCDQPSTSQLWNGNDAISLECNGIVLDVFGQIGFDPGDGSNPLPGWGTGLTNSVDNTLSRIVLEGDRNGGDAFDPADQWEGFPIDTFDGLGELP